MRRVFADHQRHAAMRVHMVPAILRVVFQDEKRGVFPEGRVGDGLDGSANGKVIVGDGGFGSGSAGARR